eukprot:m.89552 g.89552  ORF g.89552 m.89552 type:complete len:250 (+) comp51046_c0_seq1:83-832(+)
MTYAERTLWGIPPLTRAYLLLVLAIAFAHLVGLTSRYDIYFSWTLITKDLEVWRILTSLASCEHLVSLVYHLLYFLPYSRELEEVTFQRNNADFFLCYVFVSTLIIAAAPFTSTYFLGDAFVVAIATIWSQNYSERIFNLLVYPFRSAYLPVFLLLCSFMPFLNPASTLLGVVVGYVYSRVAAHLQPKQRTIENSRLSQRRDPLVIAAPAFMRALLNKPVEPETQASVADEEVVDRVVWGKGFKLQEDQ